MDGPESFSLPARRSSLRMDRLRICTAMSIVGMGSCTFIASQAVHILDRFHIVSNLNKALDEVRAAESKRLAREGYEPILKRSRWCFLKRPENLTDRQRVKLRDLLQYDLTSVRGYLLKESFQALWEYSSPYWAGRFLDQWCTRAMRSRIEPMKKLSR